MALATGTTTQSSRRATGAAFEAHEQSQNHQISTLSTVRCVCTRRRKKRLGDRCVFRGGKNRARWTRTYRVKEKVDGKWTGNYITKTTTVNVHGFGQAAQVQRLDLAAQLFETGRKSVTRKLSVREAATKAERKVARATGRADTMQKLEEAKVKASQ